MRHFLETEDLSGLLDRYNALLVNCDRDVQIIGAKETYQAHAIGIDHTGELIVRREDGSIEKINAGEVSVRGSVRVHVISISMQHREEKSYER